MNSLLNEVLDIYDDGGKLFRDTFPSDDSPDFVKSAAAVGDILEEMDPEHFALVLIESDSDTGQANVLKKFATIDRGNAVLSAHYFHHTRHVLPAEAQKVAAANIAHALQRYDSPVPSELAELTEGLGNTRVDPLVSVSGAVSPAKEKVASAYLPYDLVAAAVDDFSAGGHKNYLPAARRQAALQLSKTASAVGIDTEALFPYAESDYGDFVESGVRARYAHLNSSKDVELYEELLEKQSSASADAFALALEEVDRGLNIDHLWDDVVTCPVVTTFGRSQEMRKQASAGQILTVGDQTISAEALQNLANTGMDRVSEAFDERISSGFAEDPVTVFSSLPDPHKEILIGMAGNDA